MHFRPWEKKMKQKNKKHANTDAQKNKGRKALYPLTGDPIQYGHIDIVERASPEFREVDVALAENIEKKDRQLFSLEERMEMARKSLSHLPNVNVVSYQGLTVDYAYEHMIHDIVKGVRNKEDEQYEKLLEQIGKSQIPGIKTHFLEAKPELAHISSSATKAVVAAQGFAHEYTPLHVKQNLEARMLSQYNIGVTGEIAAGKSYIGKKLVEIGEKRGIPVHNIDLDSLGHDILGELLEPRYIEIRREIARAFGKQMLRADGFIDRKALGEIVFNYPEKLEQLNEIMELPMQVRLRREMLGKKGLLLHNAALIAEADMNYLCNNNVLLVSANKKSQERRMRERNLTNEQIARRLASQYNAEEKKARMLEHIAEHKHGIVWELDNSDNSDPREVEKMFDRIIMDIDIYGELRFRGLWNRLEADGTPDNAYHSLRTGLSEPHRYYHTLNHVVQMLNEFQQVREHLDNPDSVEFTIWTHDYIYARKSKVNEERSAKFAYSLAKDMGLSEDFAKNVYELNMITKHDQVPVSNDQAYIMDIDLSILGQPEEVFDAYEQKIRQEYSWVSDEDFRKGRAAVLKTFLARPRIYYTDYFYGKYQAQAKKNLQRSLAKLDG